MPAGSDERPIFGPDLPPPAPLPEYAPPPIPTRPVPLSSQAELDVEMTDELSQEALDNDDSSSEATLVNPDSKKIGVSFSDIRDVTESPERVHLAAPPTMGTIAVEAPQTGVSTNGDAPIERDEIMANGAPLTPPPDNLQAFENRPPVPPRNKPAPIKTSGESEDSLRAQKLYFGAQQDVTEVIGNVIFRLQCAIKPTRIDPKFGEQIDVIRETFYGANAVYLKKADSYDVKVEDWANIIVFPGSDGQRDIYGALDVVFDEQVVEIDNKNTTQFASINKLPPIVQIQIQRTAFDPATQQASKNQNRIVFDETIFLDRYMDDEKVLQRRRDAWKWKNGIRQLESRQRALEGTNATLPVTDALYATKDFIQTLKEDELEDISINPNLTKVLEERAAEVSQELAAISKQITTLKGKLQEQFTDLRQHRYRLQAVFVHRGTNAYGHYWIYIYDFARDIWREYNDERVTIVEDRKRIFEQSGIGGATPYYLVYVRDEDKDDLVDAVCREIIEDPPTQTADSAVLWYEGDMDDEAIDTDNGTQHIENSDHFENEQDSSKMDLSGMGAWDGMQAGFNGKKAPEDW